MSIEKILEERGQSYGDFLDRAQITQELKFTLHATPQWALLQADQKEALEMIAAKISRLLNGDVNHLDSWQDIEGYARLVSDRLQKGEEDASITDTESQ